MDESSAPRVDYLRLLRRVAANRWRLVLVIFVGVAAPVIAWSVILAPKTYEAVATIFIEDPRRGGTSLLRDWVPPSDASFQVALLRSRSLAEAVAETLSRQATDELLLQAMRQDYLQLAQSAIRRLLGQEPIVTSPQERVLAELQRARVTFTPLASGEVQIRAVAYQPRVAMELSNAYVEVLQSRSRSYARDEARTTREFIENFLNQTKTALQESEEALAKFQRGKGAIALPQRAAVEVAKLAQLENTLADIQASKEIAKVRLNFLRGGKDVTGKQAVSAARANLQHLRDRLAQLEQKLSSLLEKYTEHHPLVAATRAEIKDVQESLAASLQAIQDPRPGADIKLGAAERAALSKQMAVLEVDISTLEAKEEVVKQQSATLSRAMPALSADDMENSRLQRRVDSQRSLYTLLSDRLGTARIQEQAQGRGLLVIDLASLPLVPSDSPVNKRMLLGLFFGLGLAVGVGAFIEYFNQPIETEDDVRQATGLPVLGWLPAVESPELPTERRGEPLTLVESPSPRSIPAEGFRSIRTSLESLARHRDLRTLMLASAGPREGKSTVLLNLGWVFWELGRRLIVVDTDLRRPALHRALRSPAQSGVASGVADLLTATADVGWDKVGRPIKKDFLLLPAGASSGANPGALLIPEKIRRLLDGLKERADLILFDSAPILAVSDNLILASMVDGVILVVRVGRTQRRDLLRAKDQLDKVGAPLLGVVINGVPPRETRRYYAPYLDYYDPDAFPPSRMRPWNPRSWLRSPRTKRNGKKGDWR